jgi:putative hemin transport protein
MNAPTPLLQRYQALKAEQTQLRQRDAAAALGVSEAQLLACLPGTRRLRCDLPALLPRLAELGTLKAITRNDLAVHEKDGRYDNLTLSDKVGLVLNPGQLDLRLFPAHWAHAYAAEQASPRGKLRSLQFYDAAGHAIHKLYLKEDSAVPAWQALVAEFADADSTLLFDSSHTQAAPASQPLPDGFDASGFADAWLALQDVHHFHGLLRKHGLTRQQAFRHAPAGHACQLAGDAVDSLLRGAANSVLPIMVFVGNRGMVQIHSGAIQRVQRIGEWLNILDPGFNLHLQDGQLDEIWLVRRPTRDGIITAIEAFDTQGHSIVSFFGQRTEGEPELAGWRELAEHLPRKGGEHVA